MKILAAIPVYNEEAILKNCLDHYSSFCDHIIVWDNESTDKTVEIAKSYPKVEVRVFSTPGYDEVSVLNTLLVSKSEAVGKYDWVVLPDADEIVTMRNGTPIRDFLEDKSGFDYLVASGYCFVQSPTEPNVNLEKPFVKQRRFGNTYKDYNKPVFFKPEAPILLNPGKHSAYHLSPCSHLKDDRLVLLHYEMVDWPLYLYRKNRRPLSQDNINKGYCVKRFCRPVEVIAKHWQEAIDNARDVSEELPVIR